MPPTSAEGSKFHGNILFKSASGSWSENYWVACTGTGDFRNLAENAFGLLVENRIRYVPTDISMIAIRTSDELVRNATKIATPPKYNLGPGQTLGESEPINWGWLGETTAQDTITKATADFRGWTAADLAYHASAGQRVKPPDRVANWASRHRTIITNPYTLAGGSARFVVKSYIKPTVAAPEVLWSTISQPLPDRLSITIPSTAKDRFANVRTVALRTPRQRCVRGISGRAKVISVTTIDTVTSVVVKKKVCCPPEEFGGLIGTIFPVIPTYYYITDFQITGQGSRKTGRDFSQRPGRRSGVCC